MNSPVTIIGEGLGKALAAHTKDVEAALTAYEKATFPRSSAIAAEAAKEPTYEEMLDFFSTPADPNTTAVTTLTNNGDNR